MKWCSQSESQTRIAEIQQVCWRLTNEATGEKENSPGEKVINFIESGEKVNFAGENFLFMLHRFQVLSQPCILARV